MSQEVGFLFFIFLVFVCVWWQNFIGQRNSINFIKKCIFLWLQIAEDVRERWETSDHPVVHKIQE